MRSMSTRKSKSSLGVVLSRRIYILGVAIDDVTEGEVSDRIAGFIADGGPHQIATVNPEFLMEARRNPAFRAALAPADLATPDGFGLCLVAMWRGTPLPGPGT